MFGKMTNNIKNIRFEDNLGNINMKYWERRICPICNTVFYARKKYKKITCSDECYKKYIEEHKEEINEKRRKSSLNAFLNKSKEQIRLEQEKAKETCLKRYGVDKYQKTEEYKKKQSELLKNKDWTIRNKKNNEKLKDKYNNICENDNLELIEFRNRFDSTVKCKRCGNTFDVHVLGYLTEKTNVHLCRHCYPNVNCTSETQPLKFVEDILIENNIRYIKNDRTIIKPFEIDLFIPSLMAGFEINGNYWHSELCGGKDKYYHINKTKKAFEKGIKLIQIFEDEIVNKSEIVESRIKNILKINNNKIYARKCIVKEIDYKTKSGFLNRNHIDGDTKSKYNYGLFFDEKLVSVATFGSRKISGKTQFELLRFATQLNTTVIGGFSKLISHFLKTNDNIKEIITYADIRWSGIDYKSTVYNKNGFIYQGYCEPNYFYLNKKNYLLRINRLNFTKQKLIKLGFDKNKTESQIMFERGFDRIWNCGNLRFKLINNYGR